MSFIKRLALWLLVFFGAGAYAQNTTLTGTYTSPGGTNFNGYIFLSLAAPAVVNSGCSGGPAYVIPKWPIVVSIVNGAMPGTNKVWGADCLIPTNIPYNVVIKDQNNNTLVTDQWLIEGSTFNIGTAQSTLYPPGPTPSTTGLLAPAFPGVVCYAGTGTNTYHCSAADINALTGTFAISTTGNAATATAFQNTPNLCSTGFSPTGVDINGNAVGCQSITGSAGVVTLNGLYGALSIVGDSTISATPSGSSIQLHVLSGGGGGTVGPGTGGLFAIFAGSGTSTNVVNGPGDYGNTTPNVITLYKDLSINDGSGLAAGVNLYAGTVNSAPTNAIQLTAPTSVTAYGITFPGAQPPDSAHNLFSCTNANPSICSWVTATTGDSAEVVSFSSTPTFSTSYTVSRIVLTGSISTFTLGSAATDGQRKTLCFEQGSGPYTVAGPANVHGFFTIGTLNSDWNCQTFVWDNTDSIWQATTAGVINQ